MTIENAITILREHNKWRRGTPPYDKVGNRQPYSAKDIGLAIDCVVEGFAELADVRTQLVNANKELTWHKVTDGNLPKDRVFLAHCVGMGKGYVDRVCWNKRNGGFDNLNDIPPYASIKESHLDEYYDWWMEIPELPKED